MKWKVWGNHYNLFGVGPNWNLILDGKSGTNSKNILDFRHCFLFITFISVVCGFHAVVMSAVLILFLINTFT